MITIQELIGKYKYEDLDEEIQQNLDILLERINEIRKLWGKPMKVTSGYRSMDDHLRIYKEKGITDKKKIPMKSLHLRGAAIDIYDPKFELTNWCKLNNSQVLKDIKLWCEDDTSVPRLHFQIFPPKSNSRWYKP